MTSNAKKPATRFAVLILFYDCDQFILRTIANCAPHVEAIFISFNPLPWTYSANARETFPKPSKLEILETSEYSGKLKIIQGILEKEEDQRNHVLKIAQEQGFDFLIIKDADEFVTYDD